MMLWKSWQQQCNLTTFSHMLIICRFVQYVNICQHMGLLLLLWCFILWVCYSFDTKAGKLATTESHAMVLSHN